MNYLKCYINLINKRKNIQILDNTKNTEIHHIIPIACNGVNTQRNLVCLTLKEHFVAHHLLIKIYENTEFEEKMKQAFAYMCFTRQCKTKITARQFEISRQYLSELAHKRFKTQIPWSKGKTKLTNASLLSISKKLLGNKNAIGNKAHFGRQLTVEHRKNISLANKGKKKPIRSKEHKLHLGQKSKGRIWVQNGIISKFVYPDKIPEGFVRGRIIIKENNE